MRPFLSASRHITIAAIVSSAGLVVLFRSMRRTKYKKHHGVLPDKPEAAIKATAEKRQNARANAKKKVAQNHRKGGSTSGQL